MVIKFLDHNNGELKQQRWQWQQEWQKSNRFRLAKQNVFVHFLAIIARLRHETSNITQPLYGVDKHNTKFSFPFSKLRYGPFGFNPRKFDKLNEIE